MASLNELLKPKRFDVEPSSPKAAKLWKHWFKTFSAFVDRCTQIATVQHVAELDKLSILNAYVSSDVFEFIEDCETFEAAKEKLENLYVKKPNEIFARHLLSTRKQKPEETLRAFLQELHRLSKDCNLTLQLNNIGNKLYAIRL